MIIAETYARALPVHSDYKPTSGIIKAKEANAPDAYNQNFIRFIVDICLHYSYTVFHTEWKFKPFSTNPRPAGVCFDN